MSDGLWIDWDTDLYAIAERMGPGATMEEAKKMRTILCEEGWQNMTTDRIPEDDWISCCEAAARFARQDAGLE